MGWSSGDREIVKVLKQYLQHKRQERAENCKSNWIGDKHMGGENQGIHAFLAFLVEMLQFETI